MIVNGTTANTNIAVTGIVTSNTLVTVFAITPSTSTSGATVLGLSVLTSATANTTSSDITNTCTIPTNGNIQCSANTTGKILIVTWRQ